MSIGWHGSFDWLGIQHVKLLEHIMGVLHLANKSSILHLLDLNLRKNFNSPIMDISNLLVMILLNSSQKRMISTIKYYVIDIYLAHKYIFANFASENGRIGFAYFKALFK